MNAKRFLSNLILLCLIGIRAVAMPADSLPAGTKISLIIQVPGDATANKINYTVPAPVVVKPPVVVADPNILLDGQVIGVRQGHTLTVRAVNGKLYLTEDVGSGNFLFRGVNLLKRADTQTSFGALAGQLSGGATSFDGLTEPVGVSAPAGYSRKQFPDGAVYYGPSDSSPPITPPVLDKPTNQGNATGSRFGAQLVQPYVLEPSGKFNPGQFGKKAYSNTFKFSVDFHADRSKDERFGVNENLIQISSLTDSQKADLQFGDGIIYLTESSFHGALEGPGVYESSLQEYYNYVYDRMPAAGRGGPDNGASIVALNIETSNYWSKASYTGVGHWPSWESAKNKRIVCEMDGVTRSLEELDGSGLMDREQNVRRGNRLALDFAILREKGGPSLKLSYGSSMSQGQANLDLVGIGQPFLESYPDVSHIGGSPDGTITLNRPGGGTATYTLQGTQYQNEDIMMGYYYLFTFDIARSDALEIWQNNPLAKTYADLWAAIKPIGIVADEKGYIQMNEEMMQRRYGKTHPILRLWEPVYEDNMAAIVGGQFGLDQFARTPFPNLITPEVRASNWNDVPKVWKAPYIPYAQYAVTRFRAGDEPGWGIHIFPSGPPRGLDGVGMYQHLLHPYTAAYQARNDMQPLEFWYAGSTLVEDPDVKTNSTGDWKALTGPQAYGYHSGVTDAPQVAAMLRYKADDSGITTVYVLAGYKQGFSESSTHLVKIPGGLFGDNIFQIQLYGPGAHLYKFELSPTDRGQTYLGTAINTPAGYSGLIRNN